MAELLDKILKLKSHADLLELAKEDIVVGEMIAYIASTVSASTALIKYIALAYDMDSHLVTRFKNRDEVRKRAAKMAQLNSEHEETIKIINSKHERMNKAITIYLDSTQPANFKMLITGEDVNSDMLTALRQFPAKEETGMNELEWMKAIEARGSAYLKAVEVGKELIELRGSINSESAGFATMYEEVREKRPEDVRKERMREKTLTE